MAYADENPINERSRKLLTEAAGNTAVGFYMDMLTARRDLRAEHESLHSVSYDEEGVLLYGVPIHLVALRIDMRAADAAVPDEPIEEPRCLYLLVRKPNGRMYYIDDTEFTDARFL